METTFERPLMNASAQMVSDAHRFIKMPLSAMRLSVLSRFLPLP